MNKDQCCNHDCNQGRKCPVREGTHKPADAVHQIQELEAIGSGGVESLRKKEST